MLFNKKYYKIVRRIIMDGEEIKHSCLIPYYSQFSIRYKKNEWTIGDNLFVFDRDIEYLKELVESICISFTVVDSKNEDLDDSDFVCVELWTCIIDNNYSHVNPYHMKPVHLFLKNPEDGEKYLKSAKTSFNSAGQIVASKVKIINKIYEYSEEKIIFSERLNYAKR